MKIENSANSAMNDSLSKLDPRLGLPYMQLVLRFVKSMEKTHKPAAMPYVAEVMMDERQAIILLCSISTHPREKAVWHEMLKHSEARIYKFLARAKEANNTVAIDYVVAKFHEDRQLQLKDGVGKTFREQSSSPAQQVLRPAVNYLDASGLPPDEPMFLALPSGLILLLQALFISVPSPCVASASSAPLNAGIGRAVDYAPYTGSNSGRATAFGTIGKIQTTPTVVYKPRSLEFLHKTRLRSLQHSECQAQAANGTQRLEWDAVQVQGPHVGDRHTLAQLARMAGNAYALPGQKNWYEVDSAWNTSFPFGWEEGEGFRGHVFISSDNNTVVLSIKGTTLTGPTSQLDKYNDNLLFSCCCARHAWVLKTVCNCFSNGWHCDNQCLSDALIEDSLFYSVGTKLIDDLLRIYPDANVWLVGHSLGGALASLLGATYGLPAVAFESPGERLAAQRLHLPLPPIDNDTDPTSPDTPPSDSVTGLISPFLESIVNTFNTVFQVQLPTPRVPRTPPGPRPETPLASWITHVYHTADPIPFGTCSGLYSACASAGYALETKCHLGKSIILDTVNRKRWLVDVRKHVIKEVVKLLDMPKEGEAGGVDWGDESGDNDDDDGGDEDPEPCKDWDDWCLQQRQSGVASPSKFGYGLLSRLQVNWWGWGPGRGGKKKGDDKKKKGGDGEDGDGKKEISNRVPRPVIEVDCVDCYRWEFGSFRDEEKDDPTTENASL
ncbi:hypothetical protein EST38_g5389 [Candolleomyces aberdarensis]|uniref:triacylglycerol lipase n=1 Tax=Candolleomyces aberdarensis TaxID=2316362 RepID=A0A4Q2DMA3_9AGAR|nr:hypothetical protein EST38_g5389 [Candolleomyces aberdarensis]